MFASTPDSSRISPIAALTTPSMRSRCSSSIAAWTPPNWTKSCGSTMPSTSIRPLGLGGAAGGEAQRDARFRAVVDDDQIGAFRLVVPHARQVLR